MADRPATSLLDEVSNASLLPQGTLSRRDRNRLRAGQLAFAVDEALQPIPEFELDGGSPPLTPQPDFAADDGLFNYTPAPRRRSLLADEMSPTPTPTQPEPEPTTQELVDQGLARVQERGGGLVQRIGSAVARGVSDLGAGIVGGLSDIESAAAPIRAAVSGIPVEYPQDFAAGDFTRKQTTLGAEVGQFLGGGGPPKPTRAPGPATFGESMGRGVDVLQQLGYGLAEWAGETTGRPGLAEFGRTGREAQEAEILAGPPRTRRSPAERARHGSSAARRR